MNNILNKILFYAVGIGIIAALIFVIFKQNEITQRQQDISAAIIEQKHMLNMIERSSSRYATSEEVNQFIQKNGFITKNISDDLAKLNAKVNSGNVVVVNSNKGRTQETNIPSSSTGPSAPETDPSKQLNCSLCDPFGILSKQQNLLLSEKFDNIEVPFAEIGFSAFKSKPWSLNVPQRTYKVVTVVGTDENQRSYFYNKFTLKVDGKEYDIKINTAETKQVEPSSKMSWFNPHLFLTTNAGYNITDPNGNLGAGISLGISSYGRYKSSPTLSLFQLGIGYDAVSKRPQASIAPINVNIGHIFKTKIISNTYVGPYVGINIPNGNISTGLQLSLAF